MRTLVGTANEHLDGVSRILLWCALLSGAFDFQLRRGGSLPQYVLFGMSILFGCTCIARIRQIYDVRRLSWVFKAWTALVLCLLARWLWSDVPLDWFLRSWAPYVLCGIGVGLVDSVAGARVDSREIIKPLLVAAIVSSWWRTFVGLYLLNVPLARVRGQILTAALPILLAALPLLVKGGTRFQALLAAAVLSGGVPLILSATRGYLLSLGCITACCLTAWWLEPASRRGGSGARLVRRTAVIALASLSVLLIAEVVRPGNLERWAFRLSEQRDGYGQDLTLLTREAEARGIYNAVTAQPLSTVVGLGLGSTYAYDVESVPNVRRWVTDNYLRMNVVAHSTWTATFLAGGLFVAGGVAALFLISIVGGLASVKWANCEADREANVIGAMAMAGFLGITFTFNPFIERFGGLAIGLCAGLALWRARRWKRSA